MSAGLFDRFGGSLPAIHPPGVATDVVAAVLVLPDELVAIAVPKFEQLFVIVLVLQKGMLVQKDTAIVQRLEFAKTKKVLNAQLGHLLDIAVGVGCVESFIQNLHLTISTNTVFVDHEGRNCVRVF